MVFQLWKKVHKLFRPWLSLKQKQLYCNSASENVSSNNPNSVLTLIQHWENKFKENNISEPDLSIRHIMTHLLRLPSMNDLISTNSELLTKAQLNQLEKYCLCRLSRMPVQYIIGEWRFFDLIIKLVPPVFIPRPETEQMVDIIIKKLKRSSVLPDGVTILEIGCGSGAISLALLKYLPVTHCVAIDQSKLACVLTLQNAKLNNLSERLLVYNGKLTESGISDFNISNKKKFDLIVSNPPYIPNKQLFSLQPEITLYEDMRALDGGPDGLKVIKNILQLAPKLLNPNGCLFIEVDQSHPNMIKDHLKEIQSKLRFIHTYQDFNKRDRFVELLLD